MSNIEQRPIQPQPSPQALNARFRVLVKQLPLDNQEEFFAPLTDEEKATIAEEFPSPPELRLATQQEEIPEYVKEVLKEDFMSILPHFLRKDSTMKRRDRSYHKEKIMTKLEELLDVAPITDSFRSFIVDEVSIDYNDGSRRDETMSNLSWLADEENSASGGIFDPERAKQLERKAYLQLFDMFLYYKRLREINNPKEILSAELTEVDKRVQKRNRHIIVSAEYMQIWKQEFVERYQDEP